MENQIITSPFFVLNSPTLDRANYLSPVLLSATFQVTNNGDPNLSCGWPMSEIDAFQNVPFHPGGEKIPHSLFLKQVSFFTSLKDPPNRDTGYEKMSCASERDLPNQP